MTLGHNDPSILHKVDSTSYLITRFDGNSRSRDTFLHDSGNTRDSPPTRTTVPLGLASSSTLQTPAASKPSANSTPNVAGNAQDSPFVEFQRKTWELEERNEGTAGKKGLCVILWTISGREKDACNNSLEMSTASYIYCIALKLCSLS